MVVILGAADMVTIWVDLVTLIAVSAVVALVLLLIEHLVVLVVGLVIMIGMVGVVNLVGVMVTLAAVITWVIVESLHSAILVALVLMREGLVGDMVDTAAEVETMVIMVAQDLVLVMILDLVRVMVELVGYMEVGQAIAAVVDIILMRGRFSKLFL